MRDLIDYRVKAGVIELEVQGGAKERGMIYLNVLLLVIALLLTILHDVGKPMPLWVPVLLVELALLLGTVR